MFPSERLTPRARQVLGLARQEAERLQHGSIGAEHLLLALMREESGITSQILTQRLKLERDRIEDLVDDFSYLGDTGASGRRDLSPEMKRALELAIQEADRMKQDHVGTEHLLLGLVRPTEGVIIKMLKQLKITPEEVRQHARRAIQDATNAATRMTTTLTRESIRVDMTPDSAPAEQPRLRVVFSDRARNEVKVEMSLTVEQAKEAMIVFAKALSRNQKGKVLDLDQDAQTHIDVFIE
jgi:ATP-dependent Clp protease ATP-binding subunit ClpA